VVEAGVSGGEFIGFRGESGEVSLDGACVCYILYQ
jgi:hypothetical protein